MGRRLFIAGERGLVLRSPDGGATWSYHPTGYRGTFWSGTALADGTLIVGGLRGSVHRSTDNGEHWQRVETGSAELGHRPSSPSTVAHAVGLDGVSPDSRDGGASCGGAAGGSPVADRRGGDGRWCAAFSRAGLVR